MPPFKIRRTLFTKKVHTYFWDLNENYYFDQWNNVHGTRIMFGSDLGVFQPEILSYALYFLHLLHRNNHYLTSHDFGHDCSSRKIVASTIETFTFQCLHSPTQIVYYVICMTLFKASMINCIYSKSCRDDHSRYNSYGSRICRQFAAWLDCKRALIIIW